MSLLTDTDLKNIICNEEIRKQKAEKIHIYPFCEESLTPVGYDLRVGHKYTSSFKAGPIEINIGGKIIIKPRDTVLITTFEKVGMPQNRLLSALICSKVSKVSEGLSHVSTTIDPDWDGNLLIAVHNNSVNKVMLNFGDPFCTVVFFQNKSASTKDCMKVPGRLDLFVEEWSKRAQRAKIKYNIKSIISPIIIIVSFFAGYCLFKNEPGFPAIVAGGIALSQLVNRYLI